MLTALDLLNRMLSYFNIQDKAKGKAFTVVAFGANFFLLYQAIRHLRYPGFRLAGTLFLLAFFVLLYFIVLNFIYYYTDKQLKWDISPKVEKALGGNPQAMRAAEQQLARTSQTGAASGLFDEDRVLPTSVAIAPAQQENLNALVATLQAQGALTVDYQGLDERAVARVARQTKQPVMAIGGPFELPFYALQPVGADLVVMGGLNALTPMPLATVTRVGLMPVAAALADYDLAAAHVYLTGGEVMQPGRSGLIKQTTPYTLTVQLAYSPKARMATP
ncbi:DUF6681 family protein [Lacticaseibacillus daqingensis]|uniref:DUF6681 family protein n=1 Tax=Lacticaseibacillus daqingensis TaxID=2486014 RepID=UPI000F7AA0DC|nr:DUF6681 family protein [Lacticaseibacillus daqingensis]